MTTLPVVLTRPVLFTRGHAVIAEQDALAEATGITGGRSLAVAVVAVAERTDLIFVPLGSAHIAVPLTVADLFLWRTVQTEVDLATDAVEELYPALVRDVAVALLTEPLVLLRPTLDTLATQLVFVLPAVGTTASIAFFAMEGLALLALDLATEALGLHIGQEFLGHLLFLGIFDCHLFRRQPSQTHLGLRLLLRPMLRMVFVLGLVVLVIALGRAVYHRQPLLHGIKLGMGAFGVKEILALSAFNLVHRFIRLATLV